jgi:hypothetical protein
LSVPPVFGATVAAVDAAAGVLTTVAVLPDGVSPALDPLVELAGGGVGAVLAGATAWLGPHAATKTPAALAATSLNAPRLVNSPSLIALSSQRRTGAGIVFCQAARCQAR